MAAQEQRPRRGEPRVPIELAAEILLRLPPREPACLVRAAVVCKAWGSTVSHPAFRRRLQELHRTPPVLGFLHNWEDEQIPRFVPATTSAFSLAAPDGRSWRALDCRHGLALFLSKDPHANELLLLLWDPISGSRQHVPVPPAFLGDYGAEKMSPTAAVFCGVDGCQHRDCHGGLFRLVFVFSVKADPDVEQYVTHACLYSSENGAWGEATVMNGQFSINFTRYSSVLVHKSLKLYFMSDDLLIVEHDLASHRLSVLHLPDDIPGFLGRFNIMLSENGALGACQYLYPKIILWTRETAGAQWMTSRTIYLDDVLPIGDLLNADSTVQVMGFAEEANTVFLNTARGGIFTVELQSKQVANVCNNRDFCNLIPVASFYTPAPRDEYQVPLLSGPSDQAGREEGGEEEKTVDHVQQLSDKGSIAIKEGGQDLDTRDLSYGETVLECSNMEDKHGHALPSEAHEVTDPLGDAANSALNEELVKSTSTTNKNDAGNSKTSGSNVEDAAPTSEKGDSEGAKEIEAVYNDEWKNRGVHPYDKKQLQNMILNGGFPVFEHVNFTAFKRSDIPEFLFDRIGASATVRS